MPIPGILTTEAFDYSAEFEQTKEAAYDIKGKQVVLKDPPKDTIPDGGSIKITQIVDFAYGFAFDAGLEGQLQAAFGLPVRKEVLVKNEQIDSSFDAQAEAEQNVAKLNAPNITASFKTLEHGIQIGHIIRLVDTTTSVDIMLQVSSINISLKTNAVDGIEYTIGLSRLEPITLQSLLSKIMKRSRSKTVAPIRMVLNP